MRYHARSTYHFYTSAVTYSTVQSGNTGDPIAKEANTRAENGWYCIHHFNIFVMLSTDFISTSPILHPVRIIYIFQQVTRIAVQQEKPEEQMAKEDSNRASNG